MVRITYNISSIEYDRRKEIIGRAKEIKSRFDYRNKHRGTFIDSIDYKFEKSYSTYIKMYKDYLNSDEKTILYLYLIFPNDIIFLDLLRKYNKDYEKIGTLYGVSGNFVRLRHFNLANMNSIKKTIHTLQLKNNS